MHVRSCRVQMRAVHGYDGAEVGLPPAKAAGGRSSAVGSWSLDGTAM